MTTTNYIGLTQLEGHEYYSHIIENENLTKIDNALKENNDRTTAVEEQVIKKLQDFESTILIGSSDDVTSVNDSFAGASTVEIKGELFINDIDGSFVTSGAHRAKVFTVQPNTIYTFYNDSSSAMQMHENGTVGDFGQYLNSIGAGVQGQQITTGANGKLTIYLLDAETNGHDFGESMMIKGEAVNISNYFEGMQPLTNPTVTVVNENLFDGEWELGGFTFADGVLHNVTDRKRTVNKIRVEGSTNYIGVGEKTSTVTYFWYDAQYNYITYTTHATPTPVNACFVSFMEDTFESDLYEKFQFEQGTAPTEYTPHISQTKTYDVKLAKLPNGVVDEIDDVKGKTTLTARTNVGRDGEFYELKASDMTALYTAHTNVDAVKFNKPVDDINYNDSTSMGTLNNLGVSGFRNNTYVDDVGYIGSAVVANATEYGLFVAKGKYATLDEAKADLAGTKICYQLAEPVTTILSHESDPMMTYGNYTQFSKSSDNFGFGLDVTYSIRLVDAHDALAESVANIGTALDEHGKLLENGRTMTVELDWKDRVKSFIDTYNGNASSIEIEGSLKENIFENNKLKTTDGFSSVASTVSTSGTTLSITSDGSNATVYGQYHFEKLKTIVTGTKVFFSCKARVVGDGATTLEIYLAYGNTGAGVVEGMTTVANPVNGQWYDFYGSFEFKDTDTYWSEQNIMGVFLTRFASAADANGKIVQISAVNDGITTVVLGSEDSFLTADELKEKYRYFDGLQPTRGIAIESKGKNLFDMSSIAYKKIVHAVYSGVEFNMKSTSNIFAFKILQKKAIPSGMYLTFTNGTINPNSADGCSFGWLIEDGLIKEGTFSIADYSIDYLSAWHSSGASVLEEFLRNLSDYVDIIVVEGSEVPTAFVPYVSSKVVFDDPLTQWDSIKVENGKAIKYVGSNVGRDGEFYELKGSDFISFNVKPNANYAYTGEWFLSGLTEQTAEMNSDVVIEGREESITNGTFWSDTGLTNVFATGAGNGILYLSFPPEINTLAKAQVVIDESNAKVAYKLATPHTVDLTDKTEILNTYDNYTQMSVVDGFVEGEKAKYTQDATYAVINTINYPNVEDEHHLKYRVSNIDRVIYKGRDITSLGIYQTNDRSFGKHHWYIENSLLESENIDINNIYVDYYTSETNEQANATVKYSGDLASSFSNLVKTCAVMGDALDKATSEVSRLIKPLEWIEPTLLNGWVQYDLFSPISYAKKDGLVYVRGVVRSGTGQIVFNLPEGFRPKYTILKPVDSNNSHGTVKIEADGRVRAIVYDSAWLGLEFSFHVGN